MSNPRFDPHPDKWITAPKVPKPPTQRPLVSSSFRAHSGIATPPTTTRKGASNITASASTSTTRKRRAPDATPTASVATRSIQSYLTPPTSTSQPAKRTRATSKLKSAPHLHQSPTRRSPRLHQTRERVQERADRDRSASVDAWRASVPPVRSPAKTSHDPKSRSPSPGFQIVEAPATPSPRLPTSEAVITPVPSSVMAVHKRLCGQDSARRRQAISPWREVTEEDKKAARAQRDVARREAAGQLEDQRERKRLRIDVKEVVDENALRRVADIKERRALGEFKSLAHLSSDRSSSPRSSSPSERVPLASKNTNALRRHSSAVVEPVCTRDSKWPQRQPAPRTPVIPSSVPPRSQIIPSAFPARLRHTPVASPQPSPPTNTKSATQSVTPRARRTAHHHVTPPKSRTPQRREQQETLFELPAAPPRQPMFKPVSPKPISGWRPMEMQAETLMTWSMGGGAATLAPVAPPSSPTPDLNEVDRLPNDDEVIHETIPSQSFPHLLDTSSSPARPPRESPLLSSPPEPIYHSEHREESPQVQSSPSPRRPRPWGHPPSSPPRLSFAPPSPKAKSLSKSPAKLMRYSKQDAETRRRAMDHALFSSLSEASQVRPKPQVPTFPLPRLAQHHQKASSPVKSKHRTPPPRKSQPKSKRGSASSSKPQATLQAYGYSRSSARPTREFDTSFSDEENLEFEDEDVHKRAPSPSGGPSVLRSVPLAPPHPSLRPMGIREQAKRDAAAMRRHLGQQASLPSSDKSSSLPPPPSAITEDSSSQSEGFLEAQISESTRTWWRRLGHDLSSDS
ncbi:hypothetical protein CC85DRAFT_36756 [Cutaneotrichosporon oleaginosum]|uniref:Uncharacterized protein n=1 Tax=Cutaneotrichosporon oleaginosum TaxID=879819 RepID=A0A0J0XSF6_9TREE|nr:uncharacterized protein CC85DRAFT_36756 [Cutaneotrichosporon oleaginosum]KLT44013.1 hypothetical protein CC85DRAFT_36756 [Cutaneotrichosporon oleaginosum]TXT04040.1 hypothetical protein COLE_07737 [Cutaneotrichosporon oleaginosum]